MRRAYDLDDDIGTLLGDICDVLAEARCCAFLVDGFGQETWPVDIRTDLLVILEQLPVIAESIATGRDSFVVDFYEQGLQRFLLFQPQGTDFRVECTSATEWTPVPTTIVLPHSELVLMFVQLRDAFLRLAESVCPHLASHPWLDEWARSTSF